MGFVFSEDRWHASSVRRLMHRPTFLIIALLSTGCEGAFGLTNQVGEGPPRLLRGTDAGMPSTDAWVASGVDARTPDAFMPGAPDAFMAGAPDAFVPPPDAAMPPSGCGTPTEQAQLALTNEARAMDGDGPLRCDMAMTAVARAHSQDMCDQNYFSHTGRDGRSPFQRMMAGGVSYSTAGENIAQGQRTAQEVHTSWMGSSGHRANILNGAFGRIGIGLAECGGRMYWTQVFAN